MKIAYVTPFYNGRIDGRFGRFHDWVHTLREMESVPFDVDIVAFTASNPDGLLSTCPHSILGTGDELWGTKKNKPEFLLNAPRVIRDLARLDPDVIHVLTLDTICFPIARLIAQRTPLVIGPDVQGYFPGRKGNRWNPEHRIERLKLNLSYRLKRGLSRIASDVTFVTLSRYHQRNVERLAVNSDRIRIVPPGVDNRFSPAESRNESARTNDDPTRFLYVGDLTEYKGFPLFLDSLAEVSTGRSVEGTIIGAGDPKRAEREIKKRGLENLVQFNGFVPRGQLPPYYRAADFFVMPSIDENGPNTIVEALACGTPVLATDNPGINEYAPSNASIYFDRTVDNLVNAMERACDSRDRLQTAAVTAAENFKATRTIDELDRIYHDITDQR